MGLRTRLAIAATLFGLEAILAACGGRPATPAQVAANTPTHTPMAAQPAYPLTVKLNSPGSSIAHVFAMLSDGSQHYFRLGGDNGRGELVYNLPQGLKLSGLTILNRACLNAGLPLTESPELRVELHDEGVGNGLTTLAYTMQAGVSYLEEMNLEGNSLSKVKSSTVVIPQLSLTNCEE